MAIELRSWRPELDPRVPEGVNVFFRTYFYFARRRLFNRHTLWVALALAALVTFIFDSPHRREALVFLLTMVTFTAYLYLRAAKLAGALRVRWLTPTSASGKIQGAFEVSFQVENTSAFSGGELWISDTFLASSNLSVRMKIADDLPAFGTVRASYRRPLDAGMGEYGLGPLSIMVGDPLGLFEFSVTDETERKIAVFPRAEAVEGVAIRGSRQSFQFGVHDLPVHGSSVCFMGVREYERGDSLRQIAWRLSARSSHLLVKDFEKAVNAEVTLLVNMCAREHMGSGSHSTWEYAKEAALGVLRQQINEGNSVQLLSNGIMIPFGRGTEHMESLTAQIFRTIPWLTVAQESAKLLAECAPLVPSSSTLIYVAPFFAKDTHDVVTRLIELQERNVEVVCLAIDATTFMHEQAHGTLKGYLEAELARASRGVETQAERLGAAGIRVFWLECGRKVAESLLAPGHARARARTQAAIIQTPSPKPPETCRR